MIPQPGDSGNWDRFAYVLNNPLKYTDPSGHGICSDDGVCWLQPGEKAPYKTLQMPNPTVNYFSIGEGPAKQDTPASVEVESTVVTFNTILDALIEDVRENYELLPDLALAGKEVTLWEYRSFGIDIRGFYQPRAATNYSNTGVKFYPNKTSMGPISFGPSGISTKTYESNLNNIAGSSMKMGDIFNSTAVTLITEYSFKDPSTSTTGMFRLGMEIEINHLEAATIVAVGVMALILPVVITTGYVPEIPPLGFGY